MGIDTTIEVIVAVVSFTDRCSPDSNLTYLAPFLRFWRAQRIFAAIEKKVTPPPPPPPQIARSVIFHSRLRSLVTPQWSKSRYRFLFSYDETKLMTNENICQDKCSKLSPNCLSYSMVTCVQLALVPWYRVTWIFLLVHACNNHYDVTTRFVQQNCLTFHKNGKQNIHYYYFETDQD